jgi:hypothetical protein
MRCLCAVELNTVRQCERYKGTDNAALKEQQCVEPHVAVNNIRLITHLCSQQMHTSHLLHNIIYNWTSFTVNYIL